jgi:hypothetical protein
MSQSADELISEISMTLTLGDCVLEFLPAAIEFSDRRLTDLFGRKNNKTLRQTLLHAKYDHLAPRVLETYINSLDKRLGDFLLELKCGGDPFYLQFLNPYGDAAGFCEFRLRDSTVQMLKGLYCFTVDGNLKYIGKSTDSFGKRINQGYGRIHPKNCFRDGQATNCHLNALIASCVGQVALFVCPMLNNDEIGLAEEGLIAKENPDWNIQLRTCTR